MADLDWTTLVEFMGWIFLIEVEVTESEYPTIYDH